MNPQQIVRAAIPRASDELVDHVLFGRTPYPLAPVSAQSLYKAAYRFRRAWENGTKLCTFCDRRAIPGEWECERCARALGINLEAA